VISTRHPRLRPRPVLAVLALLSAVITLAPSGAGATPKPAKPTIHSITARLDRLAGQAETLTEQYNASRLTVARQQQALVSARAAQARAGRAYSTARQQLMPLIVAQYQSGGFDGVSAILTSPDPGAYVDKLASQALMTRHWADVLDAVKQSRARADRADAQAKGHLAAAQQAQSALTDKQRQVRGQITKYQRLFGVLTAAERAAYSGRGAPTAGEIMAALRTRAPSKAAQRAVDFAVAQVGKPYVWAATGPDSFDCSGLTMKAWAHAGVSIPHFSAAQFTRGRHVTYAQLKPGDLVFLYSDVHHVEIYVGAGLAISAPQEGEDVKFVHLSDYRSDFSGATRLG
jgi:cell wall-associated NlpC family hydrolase